MSNLKVVSCFSYKGGAGRSTLGYNLIPFLADQLQATPEHPLIVVDMDIDSCGLTYLFNVDFENEKRLHNVQKLFAENGGIPQSNTNDLEDHDLFRCLKPIGNVYHREDKAILFLPALPGASLGDQSNSYEGNSQHFKDFIEECRNHDVAGVFLDSAVGDQLTAKWSNLAAQYILCCLRPTKQFRDGTKRFFDKFDREKRNKKIIVIPNVVPDERLELQENGQDRVYPEYAKKSITEKFTENSERNVNKYILDLVQGEVFGIPKVDRFMWQEEILDNLAKDKLTKSEKLALQQYKKIAELIVTK